MGDDFIRKKYDCRHLFKFEVPCIAPKDFKPSKIHKKLCKVCYESRINMAFMPCKHELFCYGCKKFF